MGTNRICVQCGIQFVDRPETLMDVSPRDVCDAFECCLHSRVATEPVRENDPPRGICKPWQERVVRLPNHSNSLSNDREAPDKVQGSCDYVPRINPYLIGHCHTDKIITSRGGEGSFLGEPEHERMPDSSASPIHLGVESATTIRAPGCVCDCHSCDWVEYRSWCFGCRCGYLYDNFEPSV